MTSDTDLTIVVVSDYEPGTKTWGDEHRALDAFAAQDAKEPFDIVLVEHESARESAPVNALKARFPRLRMVFAADARSAALKDHGVTQTQTPLVGVVEADCLPKPSWVRHLRAVLHSQLEIDIASGRTIYGTDTSYQRVLTVLDRAYDDCAGSGPSRAISNNGALFRREVLERFPYPDSASPFESSRVRNESIWQAGHRSWSEADAVMIHAIGGYDFIRDFRRNTGYADMQTEARRSLGLIPRLLARRARYELMHALRVGPTRLRLHDWPLLALAWAAVRPLEIPGMIDAVQSRSAIPRTAYR